MKIVVCNLLILFSAYSVSAQNYEAENFEAALLQAKYGALLVYNGQKNSFSIRFVSKSVEPTDHPNFIKIDGILMQASITPFTQKMDFGNMDEETQKKILTGWKQYEKKWVDEQLKTNVKDKEEILKIANRPFLYWAYDMPADNKTVDKQIYLVTICFDQMLILSGPLENGKQESMLREKFVSIAATLEVNPGKVQDLNKLYKELMK